MKCINCNSREVGGIVGDRECDDCGAFERKNAKGNIEWVLDGQILQCQVEEDEAEDAAKKASDDTQRALNFLNRKLQEDNRN